ncbi:MAG: pitrilysin family protein [Gemmatimonadetes bacterium]|nr:pitrilysin family protein [Gemmatimonadota bacterium]MDA1102502.1 pitrilysin family protein [Gemmatimonadota bacterium]
MRTTKRAARVLGSVAVGVGVGLLGACATEDGNGDVSIDFERYELANGLEVILHLDRSDPIAAVAMTFHVGSAREVAGKTGFAHLFEHLFFLDSENLGPGGLDRLMTRVGSSTNGSTSNDRTNYFEVVPIDGLEKTLWAEADKLGFFINTVSESVVDKEKQVVKNEKRQSVDNQPYGHSNYVIDQALYPDGHPYQWQVIGSLADLESAELSDVVDFHSRWYGPNNATLVVAGDLDVTQTKAWIERYFGEIPAAEMPESVSPPAVVLTETKSFFHEDNYARVPMLTMSWPTVPIYHEDAYALDVLAEVLTDGKTSPFYEVLVEEEAIAPSVEAGQRNAELAGRWNLSVRAFPETDLDDVSRAITQAFARFEEEGVPPEELERIKAGYETDFYGGLASVIGKAFQLAQYSIFAGDPGYATEDLNRFLAVTESDVRRVYDSYIKNRHHIVTSFVPRGGAQLALEGSVRAEVVEEPIVMGAEDEIGEIIRGDARTASAIDRATEPPYGTSPSLIAPTVWQAELANGVPILGIVDHEVPLVQFELRMKGGHLLEERGRVGVANLLAESMLAGTATKSPAELEQAIDMLGASIGVTAGAESFSIRGSTLARNYSATMALVEEILLEPRFDVDEFGLAQERVANGLRQRAASPVAVAGDVFQRLLYGQHILATNRLGDIETIDEITVDDLRGYHASALTPTLAVFHVSGSVDRAEVVASLAGIANRWQGARPTLPEPAAWDDSRAGLYFVDVPNASQSVLRIGYLALAESDPEFYAASVMNFRLGGGGFASDLTQVLREQRGYTYGIGSGFSGTDMPGPFQITSSVRSNVTYEALELVKGIIEAHGPDFDETDLDATKSFLLRANARAFETGAAKLNLLGDMSAYGFPADYTIQREQIVRDLTIDDVRQLAGRYLDSERMVWLVVGDALTQLPRLRALGLGEPIRLDREGVPIR